MQVPRVVPAGTLKTCPHATSAWYHSQHAATAYQSRGARLGKVAAGC
jgi:hypothetical protein